MRPAVSVQNLCFGYDGKTLFKDFSLDFTGDVGNSNPAVILGPSGCGKTTLLRLMAGLIRPSAESKIEAPEKVSFVFQEPRLLPYLTVLQNVMLPAVKPLGKAEAERRALFFLRENALDEFAPAYPDKLSGGQRQRASIARAWTFPAPLILMDEPFQSLDIPLRIQLMDAVRKLLKTENRFVIAVTHDPREALYLGKRIIVLGKPPSQDAVSVVFDEKHETAEEERGFVSENTFTLEKRLIAALSAGIQNLTTNEAIK
jgi:NitT/TauT family transport system ATP-binding protein